MVAGGGPAAANLGRLAGSVSACLGFRAPGSAAAADAPRSYLMDGASSTQDADLRAAAAQLGFDNAGGLFDGSLGGSMSGVDGDNGSATSNGLRNAGQTLGRQANTAFEAMAAAADTAQGNPTVLRDVISHQLGPIPHLLDGLVSGCAALAPTGSDSMSSGVGGVGIGYGSSMTGHGVVGGGAGGVSGSELSSLKRPKEESPDDEDGRPGKKLAREPSGGGGEGSASNSTNTSTGAGVGSGNGPGVTNTGAMTTANSVTTSTITATGASTGSGGASQSENGGGASLSPAAAAPPASNLLARADVAAADFRHGGGEELMALLEAKVGRLFSLEAEYTHVRATSMSKGVLTEANNSAPAGRGGIEGTSTMMMLTGIKNESQDDMNTAVNGAVGSVGGGSVMGTVTGTSAAITGGMAESSEGGEAGGRVEAAGNVKRVLARLKAVRAGHFVVYVQFDVGGNVYRPCDVSVLSWGEAGENDLSGRGCGVGSDGNKGRTRGFMEALNGTKPWRTSQHTAFIRVSGHAYQVSRVESSRCRVGILVSVALAFICACFACLVFCHIYFLF